jgi:hypothetical protein
MAVLALLLAWTPVQAGELPGWTLVPDTAESFGPDELWEQINGGADAYLSYDFRSLDYREIVAGELTLSLETYHLGSALDAFGIYSLENAGVADTLNLGAAACLMAPYEARLLNGNRYFKVSAVEGDLDVGTARSLLAVLANPEAASPVELSLLPIQGRLAGSERYTRQGYLGLKELQRCLHADYRLGETECVFFLMLPGEGESVNDLAASLGKRWQERKVKGDTLRVRAVPYRGTVAMLITEQGLLGLTGFTDEAALVEGLLAASP